MKSLISVLLCVAVAGAQGAERNSRSAAPGNAAAQQTAIPADALPWGEVAAGLQLSLSVDRNTDAVTASYEVLSMGLTLRNVSDAPVALENDADTYGFEYEIDGSWYAFEDSEAVLTPVALTGATATAQTPSHSDMRPTLSPGSDAQTVLLVPLAVRTLSLELQAITADGLGETFEPRPGPHVIRVRTGRVLAAGRQQPVSNAVTVIFPQSIARSVQTVTFLRGGEASLQELRFRETTAEAQSFIHRVIARKPQDYFAPIFFDRPALDVLPPLPLYDLWLPRELDAPSPSLPASADLHRYLVQNTDDAVGSIDVWTHRGELELREVKSADATRPYLLALRHLASRDEVRDGQYEPRLLRITGKRGTAILLTMWLHSQSEKPDLFFLPRDPALRGWTKVESERVYTRDELLEAAQVLPVAPKQDQKWAIAAAIACSKAAGSYLPTLMPEKAKVEIGMNEQHDRVVWGVFIPAPMPPGWSVTPAPGIELLVDEADASCKTVMRM